MEFWNYTTLRDWQSQLGIVSGYNAEQETFYGRRLTNALLSGVRQAVGQVTTEWNWERAGRPCYDVHPTAFPLLSELCLHTDSSRIRVPWSPLCVRLPKDQADNPLQFQWQGQTVPVRCVLMGSIENGKVISLLIDIGEALLEGQAPFYTYCNFPRAKGMSIKDSLATLPTGLFADVGIQIPGPTLLNCARMCCSVCLLENGPATTTPMALVKQR